jgi:hypothetical protein
VCSGPLHGSHTPHKRDARMVLSVSDAPEAAWIYEMYDHAIYGDKADDQSGTGVFLVCSRCLQFRHARPQRLKPRSKEWRMSEAPNDATTTLPSANHAVTPDLLINSVPKKSSTSPRLAHECVIPPTLPSWADLESQATMWQGGGPYDKLSYKAEAG